jgi:hypothetical protein
MKIRSLLFSFVLLHSTALCQEYKSAIESRFNEYISALIDKDFRKSMDYISPDFFTIVPKEQIIAMMDQTFNNPEIEIVLKEPKILKIEDSELIEKKYYSLLTYSNKMNMKFLRKDAEAETEEDYKSRIGIIQSSFEENFGPGNVRYNEETAFFEINVEKQVYAISADGKTGWQFLVVEKKQKPMLQKLLPKQLLDRI